jgi:hypothetical protein
VGFLRLQPNKEVRLLLILRHLQFLLLKFLRHLLQHCQLLYRLLLQLHRAHTDGIDPFLFL